MVYDFYKEQNLKGIKKKILVAVISLAVIAILLLGIRIYYEVLQLNEIGGYSSVYSTNMNMQTTVVVVLFVIIFVLISITNLFIIRNFKLFFKDIGKNVPKIPNFPVATIIALIGSFTYKDVLYDKALLFLNYVPFNRIDPIFGRDIGYYIFKRPFLITFYNFMLSILGFMVIYTLIYYLYVLALSFSGIVIEHLKRRSFITHNIVNLFIYFIAHTGLYLFIKEDLIFSDYGNFSGAGFVDVYLKRNFYNVMPIIIIILATIALLLYAKRKYKLSLIVLSVYPLLLIGISSVAVLVQNFIVEPSEFAKEKQFIKYHMVNTRSAYNLDNISAYPFDIKQNLSLDKIRNNIDIIDNVRVIDYKATLKSNNELQSIKDFYSFNDADIINHKLNGIDTPIMISAREIDVSKLSEKKYINSVFKYTHGYGVVVNPINDYIESGQVDYIISGLEHESKVPELNISEPRIYYGEKTGNYAIINGVGIKEIDCDGNDETVYKGLGGIKLTPINRILFSILNKDLNMLISDYISSESRILINRTIVDRAKKAVPFLKVDDDAYIVISSDGRLKWILDAYTTSAYYPYSETIIVEELDDVRLNYIRNSVKIVIDAYDGNVDYYIIDDEDPIIRSYSAIYPELFKKGPLPSYITEHMRYPEKLFKIQAEILTAHHIEPTSERNIEAFYNNQDKWNVAKNIVKLDDTDVSIEPFYNMIRLPQIGNKMELILMSPYTSINNENMVSWLAVRNTYDDYGKLILFTFPQNKLVQGPGQVEKRINQYPELSRELTLLGQGGSRVFKGNLLVIPIEDSILYIEPIYIEAADSNKRAVPTVKYVVAAYQSGEDVKIAYGKKIKDALQVLFEDLDIDNVGVPERLTHVSSINRDFVDNSKDLERIIEIYDEIQEASNNNDWELFGKKMSELEKIIEEIKADNDKEDNNSEHVMLEIEN